MTNLVQIKKKVNKELANTETLNSLVETTFKGLEPSLVKRAIMEGMMRGFEFKDFLEKNVYAVPFKGSYSLITSIDYARKIGMRSGVVGKSAPQFEEKDGVIESCTVTIKRKVQDYIGEYTATVHFKEYFVPGRNGRQSLWETKPHTMIAKVAEMHALRSACPEEMSQMYVEEEMEQEARVIVTVDVSEYEKKLKEAKTPEELKKVWLSLPATARKELEGVAKSVKGDMKKNVKKEEKNENN